MEIAGFEIKNKEGFFSALLGVFASFVMAMGSDGLLGSLANVTSDWGNVNLAVEKLHAYNVNEVGGQSILARNDAGFKEFDEVMKAKVPSLKYSRPDAYIMNTPATIGGAPTKVVHTFANRQSNSIAEFYIIDSWIAQEKQKDYLYKGLFFLFLSFLISASQFVKRKQV